MKTRIYVVTAGGESALVRAGNKKSAVNYVASKSMSAHVATQLELVEMLTHGARVIDATTEAVGSEASD